MAGGETAWEMTIVASIYWEPSHAEQSCKHFTCISSFKLRNNTMSWVPLIIPILQVMIFYRYQDTISQVMNSQKWGAWGKGKCACSCNYDGHCRFTFTAVESFCTSVGIRGYISFLTGLSVAGGQVCKLSTGEKCYQEYDLHFHSFIFHFRFFF